MNETGPDYILGLLSSSIIIVHGLFSKSPPGFALIVPTVSRLWTVSGWLFIVAEASDRI
ncbi:hypothetical protein TorRG33x02_325150, partial [Trema orientale]